MLYIFYGTDAHTAADKAHRLVSQLRAKRPNAELFVFEGDALEESALDELITAQGLFVEKHIVLLKRPFELAASRDVVVDRLERFAASGNIFVLHEGKVDAKHKKLFQKHAEKAEEYTATKSSAPAFNVFSLGDALGARKRRDLWVAYHEALAHGIDLANIHGTLAWAARSMLLARTASSPEEAGQKPYTYSKFKRYAENYTDDELRALSRTLVTLYHDARRGVHTLDTALERFVLGV